MSTTDPDARSVILHRNIVNVGYNIQAGSDLNWKVYADIYVNNSCRGQFLEREIAPQSTNPDNCNLIMFDGNTIWVEDDCDNEPSPLTGYQSTNPKIKKIEVFNFYGKKVASSKNDSILDTSQLPSGIYIVKVLLTQGEIITKKILR